MMERALKERIIGAAILVIFVVSVVPVFLDGPPADGEIVSERVLLPGQEEQDTKTVVLERDRSVPIPATGHNPDEDDAGRTADLPQPQPDEPSAEAPTPTAIAQLPKKQAEPKQQQSVPDKRPEQDVSSAEAGSATGMWAVQLGSFSDRQNAEKLAAGLRKQGYAAFLSKLSKDGGELHRVRIGPQKNRESAEDIAARLEKVGHIGQVVPHP